jgi:acyl dehydratase
MSDAENWVMPYKGFNYLPDTVAVTAGHQVDKLLACGIDAEIFAGYVDPAFFIGIAIHAGINSGISAEGNINMLQSLRMHRPVVLDEELAVKGQILAVTEVPRGLRIDTDVWFEDAQGQRVISAPRTSLRPDPRRAQSKSQSADVNDKNKDKDKAKGAGERPQAVVDDLSALAFLASYQLTPEGVRAYSMEGNSIHYEMEPAQKAGFRAPLIGGGMGVHFLMAELWQGHKHSGGPQAFDAEIYFRRPIFWDDCVGVYSRADEQTGWNAMALLKEDAQGKQKVGTEISLKLFKPGLS